MEHSGIFGLAAFLFATFCFIVTIAYKDYLHLLPFPHLLFIPSLVFLILLIATRLFLFGGRGQRARTRNLCVLLGLILYSLSVGTFTAALTEVAIYGTHVAMSGRVLTPPGLADRKAELPGKHNEVPPRYTPVYIQYGNQQPLEITIADSAGNFRIFATPEQVRRINSIFVGNDKRKYWCPDEDLVGKMSFVDQRINFANITPAFLQHGLTEFYGISLPNLYDLRHEGCEI